MRRAAARNSGWRIAAHRIGRVFGAIIDDDRRAIVVAAEIETRTSILLDVNLIGEPPDLSSRNFAPCSRILNLIGYRATATNFRLGVRHGETRNLTGNRPTLRLIGIEDGRWGPTIEVRGNKPGQVHGVGNSGVHAITGIRHPDMRRVARDEYRSVTKLVGDEPASEPILPGDNVVLEMRADAENGADARVAIHGIEIRLVGPQVIVNQPTLVAVDGVHHAGTTRVDDAGAPGALVAL